MKINKIKLKNIRSFSEQEIEFPEGSVLLEGDIGVGKSSLLLAIEYALFGLQPGQTGAALLRNEEESGEVLLEFETKDSKVIIERRLRRGAKSISNEYSSIEIDGNRIECSVTELKTKVLKILGYPSEFIKKNNLLYRYTVYTPQEKMKQIIGEDAEIRLNILRHIFGIDKYKRIRENLIILMNKIKDDMRGLQIEIKDLDLDIEDRKKMIGKTTSIREDIIKKERELDQATKVREKLESEQREIEGKLRERERLGVELEKTNLMINNKKEKISEVEKEMKEIEKNLEIAEKEKFNIEDYNGLVTQIEINKNEIDKKSEILNKIKVQINSLEQIKKENLLKKERIFKINICPTCLQDVSYNHKYNIINETESSISEINQKIMQQTTEKDKLEKEINNESEILKIMEDEKMELEIKKAKTSYWDKIRIKKESIIKSRELFNKDLSLLEDHFDNLKKEIFSFSKFDMLIKNKQEEMKNAVGSERNKHVQLAELCKELELMNEQLQTLQNKIDNKENLKHKYENLSERNDWLLNKFLNLIIYIERNVLMNVREEFSKLFNKWFCMIVGESLEAKLDENFTPIVINRGVEMDYSFLSGGERTAVALAYRLALNQTINLIRGTIKTKGLIILDEPTDGLSSTQLEKIKSVLGELKFKQLIVVSHEQKIEGMVDQIIKVKKIDGASKIGD